MSVYYCTVERLLCIYTILADDNAVVHRLIGSQMFLNELAFCRWVKKGTENTIQFLFYDSILYSPKWI